jgi:ribonuclease E
VLFQAPQPQAAPADRPAADRPAADRPAAERPAAAPVAAPAAGDDENGTRPARRRSRSKPDTSPSDKNEASAAEAAPATAETSAPDDASGPDDESDEDGGQSGRKRRRRGGRSRSRGRGNDNGDTAEDGSDDAGSAGDSGSSGTGDGQPAAEDTTADDSGDDEGDDDENGNGQGRRRRRKRRRGSAADSDKSSEDDPPDTVVHVREARPAASRPDDVRSVKGSTRLEAKRQRRREGRESGRRRPPVITEAEFLARREAVDRTMVVRRRGDRTQIAVLEDDILVEHYVNRASHQSYVGNVYLGKVQNVLPSMEAAFVDIGKGRNAVLYAGEVNFDASGLEGQSKRIESALKSGQSILVQVTKDPVGHKGARLTSQVSLPGRYLVYVPGASMTGISRKLPDSERTRLKKILKKVMPEDAGVIVRTAAEGATEEELERDVARLSAQWENIERKSKTASAPELLYGEPDLTIRVIRDVFNEDFSQLIVSGDEGWAEVDEYVKYVAPHLAERLSHWEDPDEDVFAEYRVDEQLTKAMERKVWLPSGGSLVIDRTEAMTVIDVNTGKFTGQGGNLEETVTRNNLEAAEEIVRQLRLRDVGGIIVIDFIDMVLESNRELVLRRLLECLARDRTKHQVAEVTSLGLVQMTRKRVGAGLLEAFSQPCECCNGRGVHVSLDLADIGSSGSSGSSGSNESNGRGRGRHERRSESGDQGHGKSEASNGNGNGNGSNGHGASGGNDSNGESKPGEGRRSRNRRRGSRQDPAPATEVQATQDAPAAEAAAEPGEVSSAVATLEATEAAGQPTEPAELTELLVPAETPPATGAPIVETTPAPETPAAPEAATAELGPDLEAVEVPAAGSEPAAETPQPPTEGH